VRGSDLLARVGGEEFVLVMLDTPLPAAQALLERLRLHLQDMPMRLADGGELPLTVSIGLSALVIGDSAEDLLTRADLALYAAKRAGRNRLSLQSAPLRPADRMPDAGVAA
jgi:diguanylate cyclase (GGDEF)-like protein